MVQNISSHHSSANNIFSNAGDITSRIRSGNGSSSESDLRALTQKDISSVTNIEKDELEYEISGMMYDQDKELEKEEFERVFGIFQD